jgi:hypothetical protein
MGVRRFEIAQILPGLAAGQIIIGQVQTAGDTFRNHGGA